MAKLLDEGEDEPCQEFQSIARPGKHNRLWDRQVRASRGSAPREWCAVPAGLCHAIAGKGCRSEWTRPSGNPHGEPNTY